MHICSEKNAVSGANKATIQFHLDPSTTLEDVSFVHLVGTSVTSIIASVKEVLTPADVDRMCSDTYVCSGGKQHQMIRHVMQRI